MNDPVFKDLFPSVQYDFLISISSGIILLHFKLEGKKKMKFIPWYPCVTLAPADIGCVSLSFDVKGRKLQGSEESDPRLTSTELSQTLSLYIFA